MNMGETPNIDALLEEGLILYGLAKFEQAAEKWNQVLAADAANSQALEYMDIVREEIGDTPIPGSADDSSAQQAQETDAGKPQVDISEIISKGLSLIENGNPENAYTVILEAIDAGANDPATFGYLEITRAARLEYYRKLMPDLCKIPQTVMDYDAIKNLNLGMKEGFILSQIDGMITLMDVLSLSRMEKLDAMGILARLMYSGVIKTD